MKKILLILLTAPTLLQGKNLDSLPKKTSRKITQVQSVDTLLSTKRQKQINRILNQRKNDISFVIADLKYNNGILKFCEMGEGPRSYYNGHEALYGAGQIWGNLWDNLKQYNLPMWYIGRPPNIGFQKSTINAKKFQEYGGMFIRNLKALEKNITFKKATEKQVTNKQDMQNYQGIVIMRHYHAPKSYLNSFKSRYPGILFLDTAAKPFVNSKHSTSLLFKGKELKPYRPIWQAYVKQYSPTLLETIDKDFHGIEKFVIKPASSANGWGVIIVDKKNLASTLELILQEKEVTAVMKDKSYNKWANDKNRIFMLEECVSSQPYTMHSKQYDPTMRVVMVLTYNKGEMAIDYLGGYWKLPQKSLDQKGSLTQLHKSKVKPGMKSSAKIDQKTYQDVTEILDTVMPKLYLKMLLATA